MLHTHTRCNKLHATLDVPHTQNTLHRYGLNTDKAASTSTLLHLSVEDAKQVMRERTQRQQPGRLQESTDTPALPPAGADAVAGPAAASVGDALSSAVHVYVPHLPTISGCALNSRHGTTPSSPAEVRSSHAPSSSTTGLAESSVAADLSVAVAPSPTKNGQMPPKSPTSAARHMRPQPRWSTSAVPINERSMQPGTLPGKPVRTTTSFEGGMGASHSVLVEDGMLLRGDSSCSVLVNNDRGGGEEDKAASPVGVRSCKAAHNYADPVGAQGAGGAEWALTGDGIDTKGLMVRSASRAQATAVTRSPSDLGIQLLAASDSGFIAANGSGVGSMCASCTCRPATAMAATAVAAPWWEGTGVDCADRPMTAPNLVTVRSSSDPSFGGAAACRPEPRTMSSSTAPALTPSKAAHAHSHPHYVASPTARRNEERQQAVRSVHAQSAPRGPTHHLRRRHATGIEVRDDALRRAGSSERPSHELGDAGRSGDGAGAGGHGAQRPSTDSSREIARLIAADENIEGAPSNDVHRPHTSPERKSRFSLAAAVLRGHVAATPSPSPPAAKTDLHPSCLGSTQLVSSSSRVLHAPSSVSVRKPSVGLTATSSAPTLTVWSGNASRKPPARSSNATRGRAAAPMGGAGTTSTKDGTQRPPQTMRASHSQPLQTSSESYSQIVTLSPPSSLHDFQASVFGELHPPHNPSHHRRHSQVSTAVGRRRTARHGIALGGRAENLVEIKPLRRYSVDVPWMPRVGSDMGANPLPRLIRPSSGPGRVNSALSAIS